MENHTHSSNRDGKRRWSSTPPTTSAGIVVAVLMWWGCASTEQPIDDLFTAARRGDSAATACSTHDLAGDDQADPAFLLRPEGLDELRCELEQGAARDKSVGWVALIQRGDRQEFFEAFRNESFWEVKPEGFLAEISKAPEPEPLRGDSIFPIGSLTAPITSVTALALVEEGRLVLADPLSKYLPEFGQLEACEFNAMGGVVGTRPSEREIRIADLLTHTSGLCSERSGEGVLVLRWRYHEVEFEARSASTRELTRRLAELPLAFSPGSAWAFGRSTDVLGAVLEEIEGRSLQEILDERIFTPLGMIDTAFFVPLEKGSRIAPRVWSTTMGGASVQAWCVYQPKATSGPPAFCSGTHGLYSTVSDYLRFCEMLAGRGTRDGVRILSEDSVRAMTTDRIAGLRRADYLYGWGLELDSGFGYGVAVEDREGARSVDGSSTAFHWNSRNSCFFVDPEHQLIGILFGSSSAAISFRRGVHAALASSREAPTGSVIDESQAIEIAREAVARNDTWRSDRAAFVARRDGAGWRVWVRRRLNAFGSGSRLVLIDENGTVTRYLRSR